MIRNEKIEKNEHKRPQVNWMRHQSGISSTLETIFYVEFENESMQLYIIISFVEWVFFML